MDLQKLRLLWRNRDPEASFSLDEYVAHTEAASGFGDHLLAYDIAQAGLAELRRPAGAEGVNDAEEAWEPRLLRTQALCLARMGAPEAALRILESPPLAGRQDGETLGIGARCYKDLGLGERDAESRRRFLGKSFRRYSESQRSGGRLLGRHQRRLGGSAVGGPGGSSPSGGRRPPTVPQGS